MVPTANQLAGITDTAIIDRGRNIICKLKLEASIVPEEVGHA